MSRLGILSLVMCNQNNSAPELFYYSPALMEDLIHMKARILFLSLGFVLATFLTVEAQGQQPRVATEMETSRVESLERTAKDLERLYDDAKKESNRAQEIAREAKQAEAEAASAVKEAKKALKSEKQALKARLKADNQATKAREMRE